MKQNEVNGGKKETSESETYVWEPPCSSNEVVEEAIKKLIEERENVDEEEENKKSTEKFKDLHDLDEIYEEASDLRERIDHLEKYLTGRSPYGKKYLQIDEVPDCLEYIYRKRLEVMKEYFNCLAAEHSYWEKFELLKPDGVVKE